MTKIELLLWDSLEFIGGLLGAKQNSRFCFFVVEGSSWSRIIYQDSHKLYAICTIHSSMSIID